MKQQTQNLNLQSREFFCNTCQSNMKLDKVIEYEAQAPNSWIPKNIRRTKKIGFIFTKNSIFFKMHAEKFDHHDWGNVQDLYDQIKQEQEEQIADAL
jgi:hypothetical protein